MKRFLLLFLFILSSCKTIEKPNINNLPESPQQTISIPKNIESISKVSESLTNTNDAIKSSANKIKYESERGQQEYPKINAFKIISGESESILGSAIISSQIIKELNPVASELTVASIQQDSQQKYLNDVKIKYEEVIKENQELNNKINDYESSANAFQKTFWKWIMSIASLGVLSGLFIFFYIKDNIGLSISIGSLGVIGVSYIMISYTFVIMIIGGIILTSVLAYILYTLYNHREALKQTVLSFEKIKTKEFVGDVKKEISSLQSNSTKSLVSSLKIETGLK